MALIDEDVGKKYGRLTVISLDKERSTKLHKSVYLCKCDCGKVVSVKSNSIRTGAQVSCGCYLKELSQAKGKLFGEKQTAKKNAALPMFIGKKFGMLTIVSIAKKKAKNGDTYVCCTCECGATAVVRLSHLKEGGVKSCGCITKYNAKALSVYGRECMGNMDKTRASMLHVDDGVLYATNTSGRIGVRRHACGKWEARLVINGKEKYLGLFDDFNDACEARRKAEYRYFADYVDAYKTEKGNKVPYVTWKSLNGLGTETNKEGRK